MGAGSSGGAGAGAESPAMEFSHHMIVQLPKLLRQFQADVRAIKALLQLPEYLCAHTI